MSSREREAPSSSISSSWMEAEMSSFAPTGESEEGMALDGLDPFFEDGLVVLARRLFLAHATTRPVRQARPVMTSIPVLLFDLADDDDPLLDVCFDEDWVRGEAGEAS